MDCVLYKTCIVNDVEYYFYLNGERFKADYCSSNLFGRTHCMFEGKKYNNVAFESNVIGKKEIKGMNLFVLTPFIIIFLGYILLMFFTNKIFRYYGRDL